MDQYSNDHLTNFLPSLYDDSLNSKSIYDDLSEAPSFPYGMDVDPMSPDHSPLSFRSLSPGPSPTIAPDSAQVAADMAPLFADISYFKEHYLSRTIPQPLTWATPHTNYGPHLWYGTDYAFDGGDAPSSTSFSASVNSNGAGSSSPPLTVSPQLLHPPTPSHHSDAAGSSQETHYAYDSDMDAEGETDNEDDDEDDDDDDEYIDSPTTPAPRRSTRKTRSTAISSSYTPKSPRPTPSSSSSSRQTSVEVYEAADPSQLIRTRGRRAEGRGTPNYESVNANGDFVCETCGHVCKASRKVDFRRHVNTHYPSRVSGAVVCCGIPVEMRNQGSWRGLVPANAPIRTFYGRQMVGGCGRVFSRTDALQRHIELNTNSCVGSVKGSWHPPKNAGRV